MLWSWRSRATNLFKHSKFFEQKFLIMSLFAAALSRLCTVTSLKKFQSSWRKASLVSLSGNHHICLVKDKYFNLLDIKEAELERPVKHLSGGADDDVVTDLAAAGDLLSLDGVPQGDFGSELGHL